MCCWFACTYKSGGGPVSSVRLDASSKAITIETDDDLKKLRTYCGKHPNITYFIEQIGDSPVEIELEVLGYEQFTEIVNDLRATFPSMIRNVETVLINRSRFKWVPYREIAARHP